MSETAKQHLRGQYPAGHKLDLAPTRGCQAARRATARSEAKLHDLGAPSSVAVTSGYDLLIGVSACLTRALVAGERCIDYTLVCEYGLASLAPEKHRPTLIRY